MARIHSLKKDRNDDGAFRSGRVKHIGTVFNEYNQRIPFFFTRDRMNLELIGQYRGWGAFLVCNGPSLVNGNYDLTLLKKPGVLTYGINNGPKTVRPNFWGCVDDPKRFLKSIWLDPQIMKFVPQAHHDKPLFDSEKWEDMMIPEGNDANGNQILRPLVVGDCPNVVYYHRNEKFHAARFLHEDTLNWGNSGENGGGRTVMLPALKILYLLGIRRVYLIGADLKMTQALTYHFDEQRTKGAVNGNMSTYAKMKDEYYPALKPYFDAEGFQVFNCNPDSELKVFPYKPYLEAIEECTAPLGNLENERTYGLYGEMDKREQMKKEPKPEEKVNLPAIANRPKAPITAASVFDINKNNAQQPTMPVQPIQPPMPPQHPVRTVLPPNPNDMPPRQPGDIYNFQSVSNGTEVKPFNTEAPNDVVVKVLDNNFEDLETAGTVNWNGIIKPQPVHPQPVHQVQNPIQPIQPIQPVNNTKNFQYNTDLQKEKIANVAAYVKDRIVRAIPCGSINKQER